ncbi:hypothetical protein [uncultured Tolumonas sp.]|uniref:hypothetical protein n=1 Tax=uncultured Tolumonas sp. TaxID=263765 RepID=UPI002930D732|nr:hypothetical protein [uncultured Tolumonas sp.]
MNKEKYIHHQQQNWLSGTTGFNVATVPALNHRLELRTGNIDAAKLAETSTELFSERERLLKTLCLDDEPLWRYTLTMLMVAEDVTRAGFQFATSREFMCCARQPTRR